jgi:hypothetical protein
MYGIVNYLRALCMLNVHGHLPICTRTHAAALAWDACRAARQRRIAAIAESP